MRKSRFNHSHIKQGWVYVAQNDAYPNGVKIGFTTDLPKRLKDLNLETGCMSPWRYVYKIYVRKPYDTEQLIHSDLDHQRLVVDIGAEKVRKEFFFVTSEEAIQAVNNRAVKVFEKTTESDVFNDAQVATEEVQVAQDKDEVVKGYCYFILIIAGMLAVFFLVRGGNFIESILGGLVCAIGAVGYAYLGSTDTLTGANGYEPTK